MSRVRILEGVTLPGLRSFDLGIAVEFAGVTPPVTDFSVGSVGVVSVDRGSSLTASGGGPMFRASAGGARIQMDVGVESTLLSNLAPVVDLAGVGVVGVVQTVGALAIVGFRGNLWGDWLRANPGGRGVELAALG